MSSSTAQSWPVALTSSESPSFPQAGQVDWMAFGNTVFSVSMAMVQRLAEAGVSPMTHGAGLALGSRFELGRIGQSKMENALSDLRGVAGFKEKIFFGFGVKSSVNMLSDTRLGINCIAICSVLSEVHSESMAARVLAQLWETADFPAEYEPSHAQFLALVKVCSGVITRTHFSERVGFLVSNMLKHTTAMSLSTKFLRGAADPKDVAQALEGLFKLSRGVIRQITIVGGEEAAFIAVVAEYLFGFTVYLEDDDSKAFASSAATREEAQVLVRCIDQGFRSSLQLLDSTYVLGESEEMFQYEHNDRMKHFAYRISWETCLSRIFGSTMKELLNWPDLLGSFLGCAARIYGALALSEATVGPFSRKCFGGFANAMYGRGFVESVSELLPELFSVEGLYDAMLQASESTFDKAIDRITFCLKRFDEIWAAYRYDIRDQDSRSCFVCIAATIARFVQMRGSIVADFPIQPTQKGLEEIFQLVHEDVHPNVLFSDGWLSSVLGLDLASREDSPSAGRWQINIDFLMACASRIYIGHSTPFQDNRQHRTAFVDSGVCIYLDILHRPTSDPELARRIHVLPGLIQYRNRRYSILEDPPDSSNERGEHVELQMVDGETVLCRVPQRYEINTNILLTETSQHDRAIMSYQVITTLASYMLRPGLLTQQLLITSGCTVHDSLQCSDYMMLPSAIIQSGVRLHASDYMKILSTKRTACCIWPSMQQDNREVAKCMMIQMYHNRSHKVDNFGRVQEYVLLQKHACLYCSNKAAARIGQELLYETQRGQDRAMDSSLVPKEHVLFHVI